MEWVDITLFVPLSQALYSLLVPSKQAIHHTMNRDFPIADYPVYNKVSEHVSPECRFTSRTGATTVSNASIIAITQAGGTIRLLFAPNLLADLKHDLEQAWPTTPEPLFDDWDALIRFHGRWAGNCIGGETTDLTPGLVSTILDLSALLLKTHITMSSAITLAWHKSEKMAGSDIFLQSRQPNESDEYHVAMEVKLPGVLMLKDLVDGLRHIRDGDTILSNVVDDGNQEALGGSEVLPKNLVMAIGQVSSVLHDEMAFVLIVLDRRTDERVTVLFGAPLYL